MRPTADLVFEPQMDLVTGHHPLEVFRGRDSKRLQSLDQAGLDKLDCLEGAIGLHSEHRRNVLQLALGVGQRAVTELGKYDSGAHRDRGDQQKAAKHQQRDGTRASTDWDGACGYNRLVTGDLRAHAPLPTFRASPPENARAMQARY